VQDRIFRTLQSYITPLPGARLGVAVSGGADSVALLHLLTGAECELRVLHVNHGLRGEESEGDERFVRELAAALGLPCEVKQARLDPAQPGLENVAREARLAFFARVTGERGLAAIATGHTMDDQAETVLFRLLRGTGTPGLAGIAPVLDLPGARLVRPLLDFRREELRNWLRFRKFPWREDSSNEDRRFARNRIRLDLLPGLEAGWNPGLTEALARLARQAGADERAWDQILAPHLDSLSPAPGGGFVFTKLDAALPEALLARLFHRALRRIPGAAPDDRSLRAAVELARQSPGEGQVQGEGFRIERSGKHLRMVAGEGAGSGGEVLVAGPGRYPSPTPGRVILVEVVEAKDFSPPPDSGRPTLYNRGSDFLDGRRPGLPLVLRSWQAGDRYQPAGRRSETKLKDLFQRRSVPSWERHSWPILLSKGRIVWAREFGAASWAAARSESEVVWRIREMGADPEPL
jgi:tRNA(Ile)-lysidine synthase